jgi:hypothetical protein
MSSEIADRDWQQAILMSGRYRSAQHVEIVSKWPPATADLLIAARTGPKTTAGRAETTLRIQQSTAFQQLRQQGAQGAVGIARAAQAAPKRSTSIEPQFMSLKSGIRQTNARLALWHGHVRRPDG